MQIDGKHYRSVWHEADKPALVFLIDQTFLPFEFKIAAIESVDAMVQAIASMQVRGAPAIGIAAAFGVYLAALQARGDRNFRLRLEESCEKLKNARPTAINLAWAVDSQLARIKEASSAQQAADLSLSGATQLAENDVQVCRSIGLHGLTLIEEIADKKHPQAVNIMTHCNAGWLACVDYGTATAPIYLAMERGISVHVWVSETRPRNQGLLTAWELAQAKVPHTVIADNAAGLLMQRGEVDLVLVGTDRTTAAGDVANKIGTYLKALAAKDNGVPFYVALPASSLDWSLADGVSEIPIEERSASELQLVKGESSRGVEMIRILPKEAQVANPAFDITPARLVTGLITERGICKADANSLAGLFKEQAALG